jgi:hypothetical protein
MTHYDKWVLKLPTFVDCKCGALMVLREINSWAGYALYECKACDKRKSVMRG